MTPSKRKQTENAENEGEFTNMNKKGGKISLAKLSKMSYFYVNDVIIINKIFGFYFFFF